MQCVYSYTRMYFAASVNLSHTYNKITSLKVNKDAGCHRFMSAALSVNLLQPWLQCFPHCRSHSTHTWHFYCAKRIRHRNWMIFSKIVDATVSMPRRTSAHHSDQPSQQWNSHEMAVFIGLHTFNLWFYLYYIYFTIVISYMYNFVYCVGITYG